MFHDYEWISSYQYPSVHHQSEINYLESHIKDINLENNKLRSENEDLQNQVKDLETRYLNSLKRSADELQREKVSSSIKHNVEKSVPSYKGWHSFIGYKLTLCFLSVIISHISLV